MVVVGPKDTSYFSGNGIVIIADVLQQYTTNTIVDNQVNGKDLCCLFNVNDMVVSGNVGQVILAGCSNVTVEHLVISDVDFGVQVGFSDHITLRNNKIIELIVNGGVPKEFVGIAKTTTTWILKGYPTKLTDNTNGTGYYMLKY